MDILLDGYFYLINPHIMQIQNILNNKEYSLTRQTSENNKKKGLIIVLHSSHKIPINLTLVNKINGVLLKNVYSRINFSVH